MLVAVGASSLLFTNKFDKLADFVLGLSGAPTASSSFSFFRDTCISGLGG